MHIWASAETHASVGKNVEEIRKLVEPRLNAMLHDSDLNSIQCELRYIPIIMPNDLKERYPARSRASVKKRMYLCAPQLDYSVFTGSEVNGMLRCYLDGLREFSGQIMKFGAAELQSKGHISILEIAYRSLTLGEN